MTITPPADLHIGLTDGTFYGGDPFPAFAWMRDEAPAYFDEAAGVWGITRYADVKEISKDPETFSNAGGIRPETPALPMMIDFDAPEHVRRRRLVSEGFTPKRIRESADGVRTVCDAILDKVCEQGTPTSCRDIAAPLPDDRHRRHAGRGPRGPGLAAALVGRHGEGAGLAGPDGHGRRRAWRPWSTPSTSPRWSSSAGATTSPTTWSARWSTPTSTATSSTSPRSSTRPC